VGSGVLHVRLAEPGDRESARQVLEQALGVTIYPGPDPVTLTARLNGHAEAQDAGSAVGQSVSQLSHKGITVTTFALGQPSLDEVFLTLTGHTTHNTASEANVT
jgi:ABC-2 type transport system ATP-binding protein